MRTPPELDAFNHIQPMSGYLIVDFKLSIDNSTSLAKVITVAPDELYVERGDDVLVLIDDHIHGFAFNGSYHHRIKLHNVLGILTKRVSK